MKSFVESLLSVGLVLWLPVLLIFGGEVWGKATAIGRVHISSETPGCFLITVGWIMLLLPVIVTVVRFVF